MTTKQIKNRIMDGISTINVRTLKQCIIVLPDFNKLGLYGKIFRQFVRTKEQPEGQLYNEKDFVLVLRILNGELFPGGSADVYAWKKSKIEKFINEGRVKKLIDETNKKDSISLEERLSDDYDFIVPLFEYEEDIEEVDLIEYAKETIKNSAERKEFVEFIKMFGEVLLIEVDSEARKAIFVNDYVLEQLSGVIVDSYQEDPEKLTRIGFGDLLVKEADSSGYYRVEKNVAELTYELVEE